MASHFVLVFLLVSGLIENMNCAPVPTTTTVSKENEKEIIGDHLKENASVEAELEGKNEVTVIFIDSCGKNGEGGQREIVLRGRKVLDCYNIQSDSMSNLEAIRTRPNNIKLRFFAEQGCQNEIVDKPNPRIASIMVDTDRSRQISN